jgi:predicted O-methyltransferase YrrM
MSLDQWTAVDRYVEEALLPADPVAGAALTACDAAGLPTIAVSPPQGKFLNLMARSVRAARILEVGTLGGYSAIWLARALPADGVLVTLELSPAHADVARANLVTAGLADRVEVRVGAALDSLAKLAADGSDPFDLVFIDADKTNNPEYFRWAVRLGRPGTLIIVDNVVRDGAVADPTSSDPGVVGARRLHEAIAAEPRVEATVLQTVGVKGYDGFTIALLTD